MSKKKVVFLSSIVFVGIFSTLQYVGIKSLSNELDVQNNIVSEENGKAFKLSKEIIDIGLEDSEKAFTAFKELDNFDSTVISDKLFYAHAFSLLAAPNISESNKESIKDMIVMRKKIGLETQKNIYDDIFNNFWYSFLIGKSYIQKEYDKNITESEPDLNKTIDLAESLL